MNAAILIAVRELRDRSRVFLIAAVMAVIPFAVAPVLRHDRQVGMAALAVILGVAYPGSLALMLGISTIGRELTEKRASYLFARPISPAAMWFGKAAASFLICLGVFTIIVLPTYLLARGGWVDLGTLTGLAGRLPMLALVCTALFLGGHVASTMIRSRSARVALDAAFLVVALLALGALLRPILLVGATDVVRNIVIVSGAALLLLAGVAPVWQLARGRTDPHRNHTALSSVLWIGVGVMLAVIAVYVQWLTSPPIASMKGLLLLNQSPNGASFLVSGQAPARGSFVATYIVDTATGHRERLHLPAFTAVWFSPDGTHVAWLENTALVPRGGMGSGDEVRDILNYTEGQIGKGAYRLFTRALEPNAKTLETPLVVPMPRHAQLSEDGSRIAMAEGKQVAVYEVATGRMLAATEGVSALSIGTMHFAGTDVLQILEGQYEGRAYTTKLHHFDLAGRKRTTIAKSLTEAPYPLRLSFTRDGSRIFSQQVGVVFDARSGEPLLSIPVDPRQRFDAAMLGDGSFVLTRGAQLVHLDSRGQEIGAIAIGADEAIVIGEVGASKVLVAVKEGTMIVDLAAKKIATPVVDVRGPMIARYQGVLPRFAEDATFVGLDPSRTLVLWDAKTGAKRPVPL